MGVGVQYSAEDKQTTKEIMLAYIAVMERPQSLFDPAGTSELHFNNVWTQIIQAVCQNGVPDKKMKCIPKAKLQSNGLPNDRYYSSEIQYQVDVVALNK